MTFANAAVGRIERVSRGVSVVLGTFKSMCGKQFRKPVKKEEGGTLQYMPQAPRHLELFCSLVATVPSRTSSEPGHSSPADVDLRLRDETSTKLLPWHQ